MVEYESQEASRKHYLFLYKLYYSQFSSLYWLFLCFFSLKLWKVAYLMPDVQGKLAFIKPRCRQRSTNVVLSKTVLLALLSL